MQNFQTFRYDSNWVQQGTIDEIYFMIKFRNWQIENQVYIQTSQDYQVYTDQFLKEINTQMLQDKIDNEHTRDKNSKYLLMRPDLFISVYNDTIQDKEKDSICLLQNENQNAITLLDYELMQSDDDSRPHALYIGNESTINQELLNNINLQHIYIYQNNTFSMQQNNYYTTLLQLCLVNCKYQSLKHFQKLKSLTLVDVKSIQLADLESLKNLKQITIEKCLNVKDIFDYLTLDIEYVDIKNSMLNYEIIIRQHMPFLRYLKLFLVRSKKLILQYNLTSLEFLSLDIELELMYRIPLQKLVCIELCYNQQKELKNVSFQNCPNLVYIKVSKLYPRNLILRPGQLLQFKNYKIDLLHFITYNTYLDKNQIIVQLNAFSEFPLINQEILKAIRYLRTTTTNKYYGMQQKLDRARLIYQAYMNIQLSMDLL